MMKRRIAARARWVLPLLAALALCSVTLADAYMTRPPALVAKDAPELPAPPHPRRALVPSIAMIQEAIDKDPFRPERTRPAVRYRLEARDPAYRSAQPAVAPRLQPVTLLGLAARHDGSGVAALSVMGHPPRLLRIGDTYQGYRLRAISPDSVTLEGPDTTLILRLREISNPSSQP